MKIFNKIKKLIQKNQTNLPDNQFFTNKTDISKWLDKYWVRDYTINDDLSVDVNGDVLIFHRKLKVIPVKFAKVSGGFWCNENQLTNLVGSPEIVGGGFNCSGNQLTNLVGSPVLIAGNFWCNDNKLISLEGSPKTVGGSFACLRSALTSLLEIISCDFKETFYFNIDENNFKQKELIQILKKYYNSKIACYLLTNRQFHDTLKPQIEKEILQQKLNVSKIKNKAKISFL